MICLKIISRSLGTIEAGTYSIVCFISVITDNV